MDIEELTKAQIILLTLLVSFVTSIATGIVTVTLLDQAPPAVTQTINRIVERTVERVVPDKSQGAGVVTKEVTVVVSEEDRITDSIAKNSRSLVRIFAEGETGEEIFLGLGVALSRDGLIATDSALVSKEGTYSALVAGEKTYIGKVVRQEEGVALIQLAPPEGETLLLSPVALGTEGSLKLGQTVISLGGKERTRVSTGVLSGLMMRSVEITDEQGTTTKDVVARIDTTITPQNVQFGSPLVNIFGEVVGVYTTSMKTETAIGYAPAHILRSQLAAHTQAQKADTP